MKEKKNPWKKNSDWNLKQFVPYEIQQEIAIKKYVSRILIAFKYERSVLSEVSQTRFVHILLPRKVVFIENAHLVSKKRNEAEYGKK